MDLLITGATGFVGSHLATQWLRRHPASRVGCFVRAEDDAAARLKLETALCRAASDAGEAVGDVLVRADAIRGDMDDTSSIYRAQSWLRRPTQLLHCAANLSFREADRPAIWRTNVDGTAALLRALPGMKFVAAFNHVSTAYVAGDRQGDILENDRDRPQRFNNPYEESKWTAEALVREACSASGIVWRILRPSIVIAHSVTHRISSQTGFYQVAETLTQLGRNARLRGAGPIMLPVTEGTSLDLIPIDVVVDEIVALMDGGAATANRTFHIVGADPLRLADVLQQLTPMSGIAIEVSGPAAPLTPVANLVMRRLRHYMPYFGFARRFDRANTQSTLGTAPYRIDIEQLRGFVNSSMTGEAAA